MAKIDNHVTWKNASGFASRQNPGGGVQDIYWMGHDAAVHNVNKKWARPGL